MYMRQLTTYLIKLFAAILIISINLNVFAKEWPSTDPVPGGIVDITLPYNDKQKPEIYFMGKRTVVIYRDGRWHAVIGIPIDLAAGAYEAELRLPIQKIVAFTIKKKRFPEQRLKLKKKRLITPLPEDKTRIKKERALLKEIYQRWSETDPFTKRFRAPLQGIITSQFGLRRFFNGIPASPHMGLDLASPTGTKISNVAPGVVALAQDLFYTGNTVIIEHGLGVFSIYAHMSKILVEPGRHVAQGNVLGLVGMTGRATGPHLHWGMVLNQTKVGPLSFISHQELLPPKKATRRKKKRLTQN